MLKPLLMLLLGAASTACALAALGWSLYARHPQAVWVAQCFAAWGFLAGLACGALQWRAQGQPAQVPAALPPDALAEMVRATLAKAAAERQARPGSAADRRAPAAVAAPAQPQEVISP